MIKSSFAIYINNYDDIEFNEKIRKVQDADRMQLNVNNESDLMLLANPKNQPGSPTINNTNFFNDSRPRTNSKPVGKRELNDIALGGMRFSNDDDENQT